MRPSLNEAINKAIDHFRRELTGLRTGRANPAMIEEIGVEAYGAITPLLQLAAIHSPEPRLLVVQPWDPAVIKDIEKALSQSSLGITPVVDGKNIRLPFPAMTEERRQDLLKVVHEKAEQTRIRLRAAREEEIKRLRADEKNGVISEDALATATKQVQTAINLSQEQIEQAVKTKTAEILTV